MYSPCLGLHPVGAAFFSNPAEIVFGAFEDVRLETIRRLELEVKERRQRAQAVLLLRRNEDHRAGPDGLVALRRLDLRVAVDDEVKVFADLVVVKRRRGPFRVRQHAGEHVVDVRELFVHEEGPHTAARGAFEPRQLVLMEDVGQSALPERNVKSTGITVPPKDQSLYAVSALRRQPARARGRRQRAGYLGRAGAAPFSALSRSSWRSATHPPRRGSRASARALGGLTRPPVEPAGVAESGGERWKSRRRPGELSAPSR